MSIKQAFLLNYYNVLDRQLSLAGRVLSDIKIGDTLLYKDEKIETKYLVTKIFAYKHELDTISVGMTCELIVQGEINAFKEDLILYTTSCEL